MTVHSPKPPNDSPETLRQARIFDTTKRHYQRLGLCGPCAAKAAWGHQLGFSRSDPPCGECQPLVDTFPVAKPNQWRSNSPRRGAGFSSSVASAEGSPGSSVGKS